MKGIKRILCASAVAITIMTMSVPVFAANGARDGTGPNPIHQQLKDGSGRGGGRGSGLKDGTGTAIGGGRGGGGGVKDGSGPLRDGSGGGVNCPYL